MKTRRDQLLRIGTSAASVAIVFAACRGRPDAETSGQSAGFSPAASPDTAESGPRGSADTLAPNELAEGPDEAFGLPIPRLMRVEHRFDNQIIARGAVPAAPLAAYVGRHVTGAVVELARDQTLFRNAKLRSRAPNRRTPVDQHRDLEIEIRRDPDALVLIVWDRTHPEVEPGLDEAERWRRAGMDPSGSIIDPKQMQ